MTKTKLVDPYPNFMPLWTHAIEFVHTKCKKEIKSLMGKKGWSVSSIVVDMIRRKFNLSYTQAKSCLIGEGHRFNNKYDDFLEEGYCEDCSKIAYSSALTACDSIEALYKFKSELMKHFKKKHKELSMIGQCNG